MLVKAKIKIYPDGTKKTYVYKNEFLKTRLPSSERVFISEDKRTPEMIEEERKNSERMNLIRTKNKIKDYCLSNDFDMFWTLTFAKERNDDQRCFNRLRDWLKYMKKKYGLFDYIFIPERHKDGCIHFHGVTGGFGGEMVDSGVKHANQTVYNCLNWKFGYSTVTVVRDQKKTASYITKYVTKELSQEIVGKGKKKYWASRGLKLPVEKYLDHNPKFGVQPDWENENIMIFNN